MVPSVNYQNSTLIYECLMPLTCSGFCSLWCLLLPFYLWMENNKFCSALGWKHANGKLCLKNWLVILLDFFWLMQIVYTSVCLDDVPSEPSDFFPLSVNYQERFSAAGRTRYVGHFHSILLFSFVFPDLLLLVACNCLLVFNYHCFSGGFFKREGKAKDHEVQLY